jgi:hypothetical protein
METLIIQVKGKKLKALEVFLEELDIPYKKTGSTELDRRIQAARNEKQAGTLKTVDPNDIWKSIK